jgi:hypothetical protein
LKQQITEGKKHVSVRHLYMNSLPGKALQYFKVTPLSIQRKEVNDLPPQLSEHRTQRSTQGPERDDVFSAGFQGAWMV